MNGNRRATVTVVNYGRIISRIFVPALVTLLAGCGERYVSYEKEGLTPITTRNAPLTESAGHHSLESHPLLKGKTATYSYDALPWAYSRLPCIRTDAGELLMLDTGLGEPARITLDLARRRKLPAHLGKPWDFAWIRSLKLGGIEAKDFPAGLVLNEWQFHVLGLPLYRFHGWTLGTPMLALASYVAFDNRAQQVTIGFEKFQPPSDRQWTSYPMVYRNNCPYVRVPVGGQLIEFCADSGGGPTLTLNPMQWAQISPPLTVISHTTSREAIWDGFETVNVYRVKELELGPVTLKDEMVSVRSGETAGKFDPLLGLGVLGDRTAVWDFRGGRYWIGSTKGCAVHPSAPSQAQRRE